MQHIVLATGNPGKIDELQQLLSGTPVQLHGLNEYPGIPVAIEDGDTFRENARKKASHYSRLLNQWVIADDSGLEVDALNKAPGVFSARYAESTNSERSERDKANTQKVLTLLSGIEQKDRTARFQCCLCLRSPERVLLETEGVLEGWIADEPRGKNGFGYDPVFIIPESNKTAAELSAEEKNHVSHRGRAVRKLADQLIPLLTLNR
jgi:XTP/dITP diphosphohydrolase